MGGRVAEEIDFGDVTNGAMGDIRMATNLCRKMVCEWGMSDSLGMIEYGDGGGGEVFLARDISKSKNYSEQTAQKIDSEIKRLTDSAYQEASKLLNERRDLLDKISEALLEFETLDAHHINDIVDHGEMKNPPSRPTPPDVPQDLEKKENPKVEEERANEDDGPLAGEVVGAPA